MCRDNVEGVYYSYGGRGVYDIRHPYEDPTPPTYFTEYLNLASTQNALGVDLNYTDANDDVYYAFQQSMSYSTCTKLFMIAANRLSSWRLCLS